MKRRVYHDTGRKVRGLESRGSWSEKAVAARNIQEGEILALADSLQGILTCPDVEIRGLGPAQLPLGFLKDGGISLPDCVERVSVMRFPTYKTREGSGPFIKYIFARTRQGECFAVSEPIKSAIGGVRNNAFYSPWHDEGLYEILRLITANPVRPDLTEPLMYCSFLDSQNGVIVQ